MMQKSKDKDNAITKKDLDKRFIGFEKKIDTRFIHFEKKIEEGIVMRFSEFREEIQDEIRGETTKVLQAFNKIIVRFDKAEKEDGAHTLLHKRITDELYDHDTRLKKIETHQAV